jgi:hypothetical protein
MRWITAAVLAFTLNACGYDGTYRYPCQNPDNWSNAECQPPICKADGNLYTWNEDTLTYVEVEQ